MHKPIHILRCAALGVMTATALFATTPSHAHKRDFAFTYDWWTPSKGEKEIESYSTFRPETDDFEQQIEFETGITDRWTAGVYGVFEKEDGGGLEYAGWKAQTRYRFGEFAERTILPGAYLEYIKGEGEDPEIEAKGIFSYFVGDQNYSLNLIAERPIDEGKTVWEYAAGWSRGSNNPAVRYGLESTGNLSSDRFRLGPVVSYDINANSRAVLSSVFALNKASDTRIRFFIEYEWF